MPVVQKMGQNWRIELGTASTNFIDWLTVLSDYSPRSCKIGELNWVPLVLISLIG